MARDLSDTLARSELQGSVATPDVGTSSTSEKLCCACGKNVAGLKRFKDGDGKYWCYDCGMEDHIRKHPEEGIPCPECGEKFAPSQMQEFDGASYCEPCAGKRRIAKKREDARIAAAAEEERRQEQRKKQLVVAVSLVVGIVVMLILYQVLT